MIWADRLRVLVRTLRHRQAWACGPASSVRFIQYLRQTRPTWRHGIAEINAYTPPVGGPSYVRYLNGLRRIERGEWVPLVAHLSVTDRCGYACRGCSNLRCTTTDRPVGDLLGVLDQLRRAGTARVAITGGEPLLREDLSQIVGACSAEMSPLLFTSGQRLDRARARELAGAGLAAAYVSLDHFTAAEHDRLRGHAGAFAAAVTAIQELLAAGVYTAAQAVVSEALLAPGAMEQYLDACRGLGVHEVMLLEPVPVGIADERSISEGVTRRLAELHYRSLRDATMLKVSSMSALESPQCLGCQAGFSFVYIAASGEIFPCDFAPVSFGNVYDVGVEMIIRRMAQVLHGPSRVCLARHLRGLGVDRPFPVRWEQTQCALDGYSPGPPPRLTPGRPTRRRHDRPLDVGRC